MDPRGPRSLMFTSALNFEGGATAPGKYKMLPLTLL